MISAGVSSGRGVVAPARHGAENGRDEPLLARVMGVTGLMLWEVREPGLVLTSLQAGVGPSLDAVAGRSIRVRRGDGWTWCIRPTGSACASS